MSGGRAPGRRLGDGAVGAPRLLTPEVRHVECSLLMRSRPQVVILVVAGTDRFPCMREQTVNLTNHLRRSILAAVATTVVVGAAGTAHADITPRTAPVTVSAAPSTTPVQAPTPNGALVAAVTAPTAPRSLTATPRNAKVKLTWLRPASNGGAAINKYRVQRARAGGPWKTIAYPTIRRYTATGLTNGTRYSFRVRAHNRAGWGSFSAAVKAVPRTVPTAPRSPTATPGNKSVTLGWLRPSSNGGSTVDKYRVQRAVAGGSWKTIASPTTRSYTAKGLANGTRYNFRIRAHNAGGYGAFSTIASAVPRTVPSASTAVGTNPGYKHVTLVWAAPSGNGAKIDKYEVQQSTSLNSGWARIAPPAFPTTTTATATGLSNGTKYYFRIRAHNAAGWGQFSYPVNAVPYWTPDAPAMCTAVPSSPGSVWITVSWQAPAFDGGAPIESYDISLWRLGKEYDRTTINMPINNLVGTMQVNAFGKWDVQVIARNAAGVSLPCFTSVTM
jgi:predicted phage tail protein